MGNSHSINNHEPLEVPQIGRFGDFKLRTSFRGPKKMDRLRRSFRDSFRRRKDRMPDSLKPYQWQADETAVRNGTCTFQVKYLGCVEVFESRGMPVCEEALKILRASRRRPIRSVLHVGGDGLRVVEEDTKGLLVDQTIEKVSFCAPDKNCDKGFSYICRDGTTRRWMCHGFLAVRETGERLSHAVGCAFAVCLERKQRRDKECGVSMTFDNKSATFTRSGSFRKESLTEQQENREPVLPTRFPVQGHLKSHINKNPFAIERPHATPLMLERQSSFRGFSQLSQSSSPFKRQMSLRISDLPSNSERQKIFLSSHQNSKTQEASNNDSVTALCQQLTKGLKKLSNSNNSVQESESKPNSNSNDLFEPMNITTASFNINFNNNISNNFCHITSPSCKKRDNQKDEIEIGAISNQKNDPVLSLPSPSSSPLPPPQTTSILASSPSNHSISRISPSLSLPKPDQWLGSISTSITTPNSSPKKQPLHSRAMSLDDNFSRQLFAFASPSVSSKVKEDPFDVEWANFIASKQQTNLSMTNSKTKSNSNSNSNSELNAPDDSNNTSGSNAIIPKNTTNPFLVNS